MLADLAFFLRQVVLQPKQTSALVPSSQALARAMATRIGPHSGPVVEFGPGTGKITEAILARGLPADNLTLFEMNAEFAEKLRERYPGVTVHVTGAQEVARHMAPVVDTVVSGLPLLSMPQELRHAIIKAAFAVLRPGGAMVQFTYGNRAPVSAKTLQSLGLHAEPGPRVWANLPPAQVFVLRRQNA